MEQPDAQLVDAVLDAMRRRRREADATPLLPGHPRPPYPYEILADRYPADFVLDMMERLEDAGITESGVSTRTGWVRDYLPDIEARIAAFKPAKTCPGATSPTRGILCR